MTRTERATSPRAMRKDRSESKSGLDKSIRKDGAGTHNWGSVRDELMLELGAMDDEDFNDLDDVSVAPKATVADGALETSDDKKGAERKRSASVSNEMSASDIEKARQIRAKGLKGNVDLSAIARTSAAVSASPPK